MRRKADTGMQDFAKITEHNKIFFTLAECEPLLRSTLAKGGAFRFIPRGTSMLPTIVGGRDMVELSPLPERLRKFQIVLYKRDNGAFVLHRIVRIKGDTFTMRGDHQYVNEPGIRREQLLGIVTRVTTPAGRILEMETAGARARAALWVHTAFFRRVWKHFIP